MPLTIFRTAPELDRYTSLSTHQSQTPASFSIPILHFREENCKLVLTEDQTLFLPIFDNRNPHSGGHKSGAGTDEVEVDGIDVWVTSESLMLFNTSSSVGVTLPYPSITLHATQRTPQGTGIYMQISLASQTTNNEAYDNEDLLELTIIPHGKEGSANKLFKALSDCANLHPDSENGLTDDESNDPILFEEVIGYEGGNGLEGFPGEGGWITAENVDQFQFDSAEEGEDGDSKEILGPGAGTVRLREESHQAEDVSGGNVVLEKTKWRRTE